MEHSPFLRVIRQRHPGDCTVACLAMLLGVSYESALIAFGSKKLIKSGTHLNAIQDAAKKLGRTLTRRRKIDIESDAGMLIVRSDKWKTDHVVILKEGIVIDTDATIWDCDMYFGANEARPHCLLALKEK